MEAVLRELSPTDWALIAGAVVLAWLLVWLFRLYRHYRARKKLINTVTAAAIEYLVDVLVPDGMGGTYHVDFLLLTPRAIVVIDLRDIAGNVFGGDQMSEWTVMDGARRFTFANPQSALYDRVASVKALVGDVPVEGRIVFTRRAKFPKGLPKWTLMVDSIKSEFPPIDRSALAGGFFQEAWAHIKANVTPSSMKPARPALVP